MVTAGSCSRSRLPGARFLREAEEVGKPARARIDVDGADEHVPSLVEDLLRPVAVVRIDVEDRNRTSELLFERRRCHGGVVEITRTAVAPPANVMPRRTAAGVRVRRASRDKIDGRQRDVDGSARCDPGAGPIRVIVSYAK